MGADSKISWCQHTFNPWWGCTEVGGSQACEFCYAREFAKRVGFGPEPKDANKFPIWGNTTARRYFGDNHWNEPLRWNRLAQAAGVTEDVFCMSMGDWAEGRPEQTPHLARLWELQQATPNLRNLMLTKRPQLIHKLAPKNDSAIIRRLFGVTAESQHWLNLRWEYLKRVESPVYWLSMEPLVERVVLPADFLALGKRAWVIVGGESGPHARPMHPDWARSIRNQCLEAGVYFHFKQWGEWQNGSSMKWQQDAAVLNDGTVYRCSPDQYQPRHVSHWSDYAATMMARVGTHNSGHALDGIEWRERPEITHA